MPLHLQSFGLELLQVSSLAQSTRLLNDRCYARPEPFFSDNIDVPPSLNDLSPPPARPMDRLWLDVHRLSFWNICTCLFRSSTHYGIATQVRLSLWNLINSTILQDDSYRVYPYYMVLLFP
mmetsp:Transcript_6037/g.11003  ORF Transcript_6037/g.11003 Transcript_6037/m.11003 type:complete len:121 (-) Transcript_6037:335-697(-)